MRAFRRVLGTLEERRPEFRGELVGFAGNTAAALGYIQTLVAGGDDIYRRDNSIQLRIAYSRLWSTTDPWTQTTTSGQLPEFRTYWTANMSGVTRDVAHMFSARALGGARADAGTGCGRGRSSREPGLGEYHARASHCRDSGLRGEFRLCARLVLVQRAIVSRTRSDQERAPELRSRSPNPP